MIDLSIIIVSWNVADLLNICIKAINQHTLGINKEVIVVDNDSCDGTTDMVENNFKDILLIKNKLNLGFAKACNQGIRIARGKLVLLLNPDTEVKKGIENILRFAESDVSIGVVGCQLVNNSNKRMLSYQSFPTVLRIFTFFTGLNKLIKHPIIHKILQPVYVIFPSQTKHRQLINKIEEVDSVSGAFFLCRKELFSKIGLFDENYFMYFEETDFCKKAKSAGFNNYYFPDYRIVHLEGESAKKSKSSLKYYADSLLYYFKKNNSYSKYLVACFVLNVSILIRILFCSLIWFFNDDARHVGRTYFRLLLKK